MSRVGMTRERSRPKVRCVRAPPGWAKPRARGRPEYQPLRAAGDGGPLRADISEEAWESVNSTVSRPFPRPSKDKIAIKVINHYGDEVMKVVGVA